MSWLNKRVFNYQKIIESVIISISIKNKTQISSDSKYYLPKNVNPFIDTRKKVYTMFRLQRREAKRKITKDLQKKKVK